MRGPSRRAIAIGGCACVALGGAGLSMEFAREQSVEDAAADALRDRIVKEGGFAIVMDRLQARIGPRVVLPDRPVKLTDLGAHRLGPLESLAEALAVYPTGFVGRFVETVALASDIVVWRDTTAGGFFFQRGVCLNDGGWSTDQRARYADLFHHELSSLIRLSAPIDEAAWTAFNPPGFHYLAEDAYRMLLENAPDTNGGANLFQQGFIRPYGRSDIDDDWNTYAERILGHGKEFATLIRSYPPMRGKARILMETYERLDPRFASLFDATGLKSAVSVRS